MIPSTGGGPLHYCRLMCCLPISWPPQNTKDIDGAMGAIETVDTLLIQPAGGLGGDRSPFGIGSAPLGIESRQSCLASTAIITGIFDPQVHVIGQDGLMAQQEVHAA